MLAPTKIFVFEGGGVSWKEEEEFNRETSSLTYCSELINGSVVKDTLLRINYIGKSSSCSRLLSFDIGFYQIIVL